MNNFKKPIADLLRPQKLSEFVGQDHLVGKGGPIRKLIESGNFYSMVFWGPPGCGKTTLARIISNELNTYFLELSPVTSGVNDIKKAVLRAKEGLKGYGKRTILFIDEIHRFNKAQQDYLLPHVEDGTIILIGATTENPSFEIIPPLLSRCQVYVLKPLSATDIRKIISRALNYLKKEGVFIKLTKDALAFMVQISCGDARVPLNILDAKVLTSMKGRKRSVIEIPKRDVENILQKKALFYDKNKEEHYNTISAFIKSMRAGNVDAALYYLARMVEGGEDPLFIARRMVIFASEDIGMAQPTALVVANEVFRACETIGYPECQINLAHGTVYLAKAKKNRDSYNAYFKALEDVKKYGRLPIPLELRNAPTKLMKELGYGKGYEMYSKKDLLPPKLRGKKYFIDK